MKVLLLAAGRSKRLKPVEDKNLLSFLGRPLILRQIDELISAGLKDIIVIGGDHNLREIRGLIKNTGRKIQVIEQKDLDAGMAGAVLAAEKFIKNDGIFIVSANDVVDTEAYKLILKASKDKSCGSYIIGKKVDKYFPGGYLKVRPNGLLTGIVEKPGAGKEPGKLINLVLHFHRDFKPLLAALKKVKTKRDDHYEVALDQLIKEGARMKVVPYNGFWQAVKYPWHIINLMNHFFDSLPKGRSGSRKVEIAASATIKGNVYLEDGVRILENAVISGPAYIGKNTIIATNALVRGSQVGENCVIGFGSEIARSILFNNVWTHSNYIGDSIIGNNCSFGSGTVTGNLRLDEANIGVNIQGEKTDSGTNKLGLIAGDNMRCGINTSFMPGIKIGRNCFIGAGITVAQDIEDNKYVYGKSVLTIKENSAKPDIKNREKMKKRLS
jgi:UDP-N-acetylglucosamine diphosphorylase / glucose-1-phosphate thymidylyltransferase / UDP-N-acetylgalactosamine diphosphorylase / glucosamine-1-phosphate N-acetyltransferase / galactosamine-1-phosphate N-acetyltransferase